MRTATRRILGIGAAGLLGAASLGISANSATAADESASGDAGVLACHTHFHENEPGIERGTVKAGVDGANMRKGPHKDTCSSNGVAYRGHDLRYHCFTVNENSDRTWTWVVNETNGKKGWIRDDLLTPPRGGDFETGGSFKRCTP